jgi:putative transposase
MAISFKGAHFPKEIILMGVRWYVAYPLSTRHVEELMEERGVELDHATMNRWVIKYSPQLEAAFHRPKQQVWVSWRMDETYIKVKGEWRYLYRAVDKQGQTIDFLLTEQRDEQAAKRFLTKAIRRHGVPKKITIDGSAANKAAITSYNEEHGTAIAICRAAGVAARYVSGHLLGEGGSHAWVEVLLPHGEGYCAQAYDPTNGRRCHMGYTTVAVGRDYGDVSPVSGVYTAPYAGQLSCSKQAGITFLAFATGETVGHDRAC